MSVSFSATTAIGVKTTLGKLYAKVRVPCCDCARRDPAANYCAECGKPTWKDGRKPVDGYNPHREELGAFAVVEGTGDGGHEFNTPVVIAATHMTAEEQPTKLNLVEPIETMRERLKATLEPLGLWDESKFGLWVIPCVSC